MKNVPNAKSNICPVCWSKDVSVFFEIQGVPVHCNVLCSTTDEAFEIPRGDIHLGFCMDCGHVWNLLFDPDLVSYSQSYENSLHFSEKFQEYAQTLARWLIDKYQVYRKEIIEIGCGQGDFLTLLCTLGHNRGVGFDLSYRQGSRDRIFTDRVEFIQDLYSETYAMYPVDLLCCRHVLEHVAKPVDFLRTIRRAIGDRPSTAVYFEVPNALATFRDLAIWDIIYEHCSFFSAGSLAHLFASCGFKVCEVCETYEGQFLYIEALPMEELASPPPTCWVDLVHLSQDVQVFAERFQHKKAAWEHYLKQIESKRRRTVVWGAGSKGVTYLNMLKIRDQIEYVVDVNPRKQGMYVAGTGQQIVPPEFLTDYQPDLVLVMNPIYYQEIQQTLESIGVNAEIRTV